MKSIGVYLACVIAAVCFPAAASAGEVTDHAPIGVMGDHLHEQGEWMASYRYMRMDMPQNYSGVGKMSVADVHKDFMISPIEMTMDMHMLGIMYGVTDDITAMVMVPFVSKSMSHRLRSGLEFTTETDGISDVKLAGLFSVEKFLGRPVHFNFGLSFPTGSTDERGKTPAGPNQYLPYPMQLGSGTVALLPGVTYLDHSGPWSWGAQQASTIQLGKNDENYQLGDSYTFTGWVGYTWADWISTSIRAKGSIWGNINGVDPRLAITVPTADPNRRGGERIDMFLGVNLLGTKGAAEDHRLALEVGYPVYQSLDGPQLGAGVQGTFGWQKAW